MNNLRTESKRHLKVSVCVCTGGKFCLKNVKPLSEGFEKQVSNMVKSDTLDINIWKVKVLFQYHKQYFAGSILRQ